jgi:hypothetical protein
MPTRSRLLLIALLTLALLLFTLLSAPFTIASAVRLWLWWNARQQRLALGVQSISAPFLRPVVIRGLRVRSAPNAASQLDVNVAQATIGLNLKTILLRRKMRLIRAMNIEDFHLNVRQASESQQLFNEAGWRALHNLLPDAFKIEHAELRWEDRQTVILLRNVSLSGSEIESGSFNADQVVVASPWLRQTFAQLRGGTKWEENRLTVAGLSLTTGVDLASATIDLSELVSRTIGIHFDAEVFGGEIRADISRDWGSAGATWNVAGSASEISLARLAGPIGFTDDVRGLLHACKFSLRGNLLDPLHATGWIWTELTHLQWRGRALDLAMLGATFNNRQITLQQLYLKQSGNELTAAGEATLPGSLPEWPNIDARADLSASLRDLENFARLCGANPGTFGGSLSASGTLRAHDRQFEGGLNVDGSELTISHAVVDRLRARLSLSGTQISVEELALDRRDDFLRAAGKIDISPQHIMQGSLALSVANVGDYFRHSLPASGLSAQLIFQNHTAAIDSLTLQSGSAHIDFTGTGNFGDLRNMGTTIVPDQALFDAGALVAAGCVSGLQLLPLRRGAESPLQIRSIALRGNLFSGDWQLMLQKEGGPDEFIRACRRSGGRTLEILVDADTNREFGMEALRSFRNGNRKALSLSLDPQ